MNDQQLKRIKQSVLAVTLCTILLETLDEVDGVPSGHAYMAFMGKMNVDQFQGMLAGLQKVKAIEVSHDFITKGNDFQKVMESYKGLIQKYNEKFN